MSFNSAEAEEWFRRKFLRVGTVKQMSFNSAEAEEGFRKYIDPKHLSIKIYHTQMLDVKKQPCQRSL